MCLRCVVFSVYINLCERRQLPSADYTFCLSVDQQLLRLPNGRFTIVAKETLNTLKKAGAIASTPPTIVTTKSTPTPISTAATSSAGQITTNKVTAVNASGALGDHMSMATKGRNGQVCSIFVFTSSWCVVSFCVVIIVSWVISATHTFIQ